MRRLEQNAVRRSAVFLANIKLVVIISTILTTVLASVLINALSWVGHVMSPLARSGIFIGANFALMIAGLLLLLSTLATAITITDPKDRPFHLLRGRAHGVASLRELLTPFARRTTPLDLTLDQLCGFLLMLKSTPIIIYGWGLCVGGTADECSLYISDTSVRSVADYFVIFWLSYIQGVYWDSHVHSINLSRSSRNKANAIAVGVAAFRDRMEHHRVTSDRANPETSESESSSVAVGTFARLRPASPRSPGCRSPSPLAEPSIWSPREKGDGLRELRFAVDAALDLKEASTARRTKDNVPKTPKTPASSRGWGKATRFAAVGGLAASRNPPASPRSEPALSDGRQSPSECLTSATTEVSTAMDSRGAHRSYDLETHTQQRAARNARLWEKLYVLLLDLLQSVTYWLIAFVLYCSDFAFLLYLLYFAHIADDDPATLSVDDARAMWAIPPWMLTVDVLALLQSLLATITPLAEASSERVINVRNLLCVLIDVGALGITLTLFGLAPAVLDADVDAISNDSHEFVLLAGCYIVRVYILEVRLAFNLMSALGDVARHSRGIGGLPAATAEAEATADAEAAAEAEEDVLRLSRHFSGSSQNASSNVPGSPGAAGRRADANARFLSAAVGARVAATAWRKRIAQRAGGIPRELGAFEGPRPLRILCMDGGGTKGYTISTIMRRIESLTGKPACDMFDLICGTSIGGCGVACVSLAKDTEEHSGPTNSDACLDALISQVLPKRSICHFLRTGHKVPSPVIDGFFKDTVLSTLGIDSPNATFPRPCDGDGVPGKRVPHSFVVSAMHSNLDGSWQPFLLSNYERLHVSKGGRFQGPSADNWPLWEMLAATTRAPTFFEPWEKKGHEFVDGGIVANNPAMLAISEAMAIWPNRPIGTVVSVGCGHSLNTAHKAKKGIVYWANQLVDMATDSYQTHTQVKQLLQSFNAARVSNPIKYFRLEPTAAPFAFMDARRRAIQEIKDVVEDYVDENEALFHVVASSLLAHDDGYVEPSTERDAADHGHDWAHAGRGGMLNEMDLGEAEFFAENSELGRVEEKVEELRARGTRRGSVAGRASIASRASTAAGKRNSVAFEPRSSVCLEKLGSSKSSEPSSTKSRASSILDRLAPAIRASIGITLEEELASRGRQPSGMPRSASEGEPSWRQRTSISEAIPEGGEEISYTVHHTSAEV